MTSSCYHRLMAITQATSTTLTSQIPLTDPPSTYPFFLINDFSFPLSCPDEHKNIMLAYTLPAVLASVALAMPTTPNLYNLRNLFRRDSLSLKAADPFDRTWIETLTSVGESYAAGIGAGHAVKPGKHVSSSISACHNHRTNPSLVSWKLIQTVINTAMAIPTWSTWMI